MFTQPGGMWPRPQGSHSPQGLLQAGTQTLVIRHNLIKESGFARARKHGNAFQLQDAAGSVGIGIWGSLEWSLTQFSHSKETNCWPGELFIHRGGDFG